MLYFVLGRAKRKPGRLTPSSDAPEPLVPKELSNQLPNERDLPPAAVRNQNGIFFAFNGHEWDAYEVLGCPQEAGLDQVTKEYQSLLRTSDPSTFDFYEAAYLSILKSKRS